MGGDVSKPSIALCRLVLPSELSQGSVTLRRAGPVVAARPGRADATAESCAQQSRDCPVWCGRAKFLARIGLYY